MRILLKLFKLFLNAIYLVIKLFPTNSKKITFLSRQSNNISLDMEMIKEELLKNDKDLKLVFLCKRFDNFKKHFLSYSLYTIKTMYHIATSKVCVTDSYSLPISVLKHKKSLKVMQIWHAMGAIKKFGYQSVGKTSGRNELISKELNMHKNYDKIISGSDEMTKYFMEAFGYGESFFLNYGLPRIDHLIKNEREIKKDILKKYPKFKNKKNILYAPTFRTTKDDMTLELIKNIDFNKYNLIVKAHKNQEIKIDNENIYLCPTISALDLLTVCDFLITDYSAIAIEAAILNKKTYYYVFDYEKYNKNNGLNINLFEEMKDCVYYDAKDLVNHLENKNYNMKKLKEYKNKYITNQKGNATQLIAKQIIKWIKE